MGFDEGHFAFDSPNLTYYTGQIVYGKLVFDQNKLKTFRGLYVKIKGYCDVHWTSEHTRRVNDRTEHYIKHHNSHETYFEQKIFLMGDTDGEVHLQPGHHEFPFQCQIPLHCPSSFKGGNGFVQYEVKAVVDRSFKFDQEKVAVLTVVAPIDLNADPYCKEPTVFNFKEAYCCCCVSNGNCEVVVSMPQSGYCPGQTMHIELDCANRSSVEIDEIVFEVKKTIEFRATHEPDTRTDKAVIAELKKGPIPANTTRKWALEMEIPQTEEVYNLNACSYIDIDYKFKVTMTPSGCHSDSSASRRLVMGTIPLREFESNEPLAEYPNARPLETNQAYPPSNQTYPSPNQQYPAVNSYPPSNSPYPGGNQPYPGGNPPYPGGNPPYPGGNPPYPGGNPPYPGGNQPYPGGNPPYPGGNQTYPGGNPPYPGGNPPYPGGNRPYPGGNQPYPGANLAPYPNVTPTLGFSAAGDDKGSVTVPLLPPTAAVPYPPMPSPYAAASAPEPSTPDVADDKMPMQAPPASNPVKSNKQ